MTVKSGRPTPTAAATSTVGLPVLRFWEQMVRPGARVAAAEAGNADAVQDRNHLRRVAPQPRCAERRERTAVPLASQVDLGCQAAPRATQCLIPSALDGSGPFAVDPRRLAPGTSRVPMGASDTWNPPSPWTSRYVPPRRHQPARYARSSPRCVRRPHAVPRVDRLPLPKPSRWIPPWDTRPGPEQDPVDDPKVTLPSAALPDVLRKTRLQTRPFCVPEIAPPHTP